MVKFDLTGYFSLSSTTATEDGAVVDGGDGEDRGQHDRNQIAQAVLFDEAVDGVNNEESNNKTTSSKNRKRNKKKRQKAKAKKQLQQQQQQQAANNDNNHNDDKTLSSSSSRSTKKCSFGNVSTREYQRCFMGSDGVPNDGGWPLGLGDKVIYEYNTSVDTYEDLKQQELRERYQTFLKMEAQQQGHSKQQQQKKTKEEQHLSSTSNNNNNQENIGDDIYFETRQYDYRRQSSDGVGHIKDSNKDTKVIDNYGRNPLFKPCNEDTRKFLIIRDHEITVDEMLKSTNKIPSHNILRKESTSSSHHSSHHSSSNNHHNNENGNHHQSNNNARRPRSNSFQRKRSNSFNHHDESSSSSTSNHSFSSHDIRHVRNELEHIRISRSSTASSGCNCKKQTFYFPTVVAQQEEQSINNNTSSSSSPKKAKSSSKKRHNHHPLTERRLREEIRKRRNIELSTNINNASREEMEAKLYEHMKNEPCCWSMDCPCVKSGIGCQADCCSCWKNNNNSNKELQDESDTQRIQSICGNPNGMYVVDMDGISQYRKNIIGCMEVSEKLKKDCAPIYADIRRKSLS